jgi:DNA-binding phage protein
MDLTRESTPVERAKRDPAFARALLAEAGSLFLQGEPATARMILHYLVNATLGFEGLATETEQPIKSLHRMLSSSGNPSMDNLAAIFDAMSRNLGAAIQVQAVALPRSPEPSIHLKS